MKRLPLVLLLSAAIPLASAQTTKPKPPSKTSPTLGTVQLPGDNGKLKTTYQLGDKQSELHFTLESAAFATVFPAPTDLLVAGQKERLLVLNFTVQNPLNREQKLASSSFRYTVVSPDDENFEHRGYLLQTSKRTRVDQSLKPAQKVNCTVVIPIYAEGPVPKVIVQRGTAPVVRYNLTDKVQKLNSVFSPDGIDMTDVGPAIPAGGKADMGPFHVTFDGVSTTSEEILGQRPSSGEVYYCVDVTFTNMMQQPVSVGFQYFTPLFTDSYGEKFSWNGELVSRTNDRRLSQEVGPGESISGRYYFRVPGNRTPKTFKYTHVPTQRTLSFELP